MHSQLTFAFEGLEKLTFLPISPSAEHPGFLTLRIFGLLTFFLRPQAYLSRLSLFTVHY